MASKKARLNQLPQNITTTPTPVSRGRTKNTYPIIGPDDTEYSIRAGVYHDYTSVVAARHLNGHHNISELFRFGMALIAYLTGCQDKKVVAVLSAFAERLNKSTTKIQATQDSYIIIIPKESHSD